MHRFVRNIAIAAVVVTTTGIAAATQASADPSFGGAGDWASNHVGSVALNWKSYDGNAQVTRLGKGGYKQKAHKTPKKRLKVHKLKRSHDRFGHRNHKSTSRKWVERRPSKGAFVHSTPHRSHGLRRW